MGKGNVCMNSFTIISFFFFFFIFLFFISNTNLFPPFSPSFEIFIFRYDTYIHFLPFIPHNLFHSNLKPHFTNPFSLKNLHPEKKAILIHDKKIGKVSLESEKGKRKEMGKKKKRRGLGKIRLFLI